MSRSSTEGIRNGGADNNDSSSLEGTDDEPVTGSENAIKIHHQINFLQEMHLSLESEYDETLEVPDSLTIISVGGDNPILVERNQKDGSGGDDDDDDLNNINDQMDGNDNNINGIDNNSKYEIPFTSIYGTPIKFTSFSRKIFMPNLEIQVKIVDNERNATTHLLNPNLYTIELTHGNFTWQIKKRYKHFSLLQQQLRVFKASLNFPFPTRSQRERRATIKSTIQREEQIFKECTNSTPLAPLSGEFNNVNSITPEFLENDRNLNSNSNTIDSNINSPGSSLVKNTTKKSKKKLPRFPNRPETLITVESLPTRIKQLEEYLYNLLNISLYRNHHETIKFLEVSNLSFVSGLGIKGKEGAILKRTGSTRPGQVGCNCFGCFHGRCCVRCNYFCSDVLCGKWRNRWLFVKETCFGYLRPSDGEIRCVVLFDQGFDVSTGIYQTGMRRGLQILTYNRHLVLKCWTRRKAKDWLSYLKLMSNTHAKDFTHPNPYNSFAPQRSYIKARWFVDGSNYMRTVADAMELATEEIYIADWWLSPEIYMKRPIIDGDYWRLDRILHRKASQGVRVFVLLYKEVEAALGINSYYSKQKLHMTHENIKVIRHPDHARAGVLLWAHHEKIVVVDQTYAFVGGIDLCYGRWDDHRHRLTDMGSITTSSIKKSKDNKYFDDADSAISSQRSRNVTIDFQDYESQQNLPQLSPGEHLYMPSAYGNEDAKLAENIKQDTPEMERKKYLEKFKDNMIDNMKKGKEKMSMKIGNKSPAVSPSNDTKSLFFSSHEIEMAKRGGVEDPTPHQTKVASEYFGEAKYWFGKDYANFIMKDFACLEAPYQDLVDRTTTPRMPWHDIGMMVIGESARDVARHFIQRWNAAKLEKNRANQSFPYLMPKSYNDIRYNEKFLSSMSLETVTCQVLRSVESWSCGFIENDLVEQSIHDAYVETITRAQHYIYIENQFFITLQMSNGNLGVRNQIGETLFKRIVRAHNERKVFRVFVIMPLLPGFEGDIGGASGNALRAITHWNYASISRGKNSILYRLKEAGIKNPEEYITFHSLRTHAVLNDTPITELIYVHSKLLIADDRVVICGSANINDRSLIGSRDSEIAVIITDIMFEDGRMNGEPHPSGLFAGRLRKYLFSEHLGMLEPGPNKIKFDIVDPIIDTFWNGIWKRTSLRNTIIYDEAFKCIPTDNVKTFDDLQKYLNEPPLIETDFDYTVKRIADIQGFLVHLPLDFLNLEKLTPPSISKEGLMPNYLWT
ncbi:phospholipase D2 isoform X2 [Condylostylus longicornis]|nr:phospholipase D2 isoform X2 [Condylostylus longicornis]XP_055383298.1 phospholipase D2 isoform X2 [Condylostylus longicornis]XP_055383299.1 phospholipase D2 isoform X2 [Condylostylus longicornis]